MALAVLERDGVLPESQSHRAAVLFVDEDVSTRKPVEVLNLLACLAERGYGLLEPVPRDLVACDTCEHGGTITAQEV